MPTDKTLREAIEKILEKKIWDTMGEETYETITEAILTEIRLRVPKKYKFCNRAVPQLVEKEYKNSVILQYGFNSAIDLTHEALGGEG